MTNINTATELHITATTETTAIELLAEHSKLSKAQLKQAMHKGAVWLTQNNTTKRVRRAKKVLKDSDQLHLYYNPNILSFSPSSPLLIADYTDYSIWFKPYGVYCQGSKWGDHCTINRLVTQDTDRPSFIVHRLDRATTGLIIISHTKTATIALTSLFKQRAIKKCYLAIVHGECAESSTISTAIEGRTAVTHIKRCQFDPHAQQSLVDVNIETGRKHQIRRHLSECGHPIIGDRLYGLADEHQSSKDLQLCCYALGYTCPLSGRKINIELTESLRPVF